MKHLKRHFTKYFAVICSVLVLTVCNSCEPKKTLSVNPTELTFTANATDQQSVVIDTDAPGWDYVPSDPWIVGEQSSVILKVTTQQNSSNSARTGAIKITAGNAKPVNIIVQQDAKSSLSAEPASLTFEAEDSAEKKVSITTSAQGGWNFTTPPSWLTCSKDNNQLVFKVEKNTSSSQRNTTINIVARSADTVKVAVTQKAPTLTVSPSTITLATSESQQTINVASNTSWTVSSLVTWLTVSPTSGSNDGSVVVKATANTGSSRSGTVTFKAAGVTDKSVTVNQDGKPSLEVSKTSLSFGNSAQSGTFDITSNVSWTVTRGSYSWITVSAASGSNNASITVSVTANTSTSSRSGTVTVSGGGFTKTVNVLQSGSPPTTAQVRFRKLSNNTNVLQMAVASTAGDVLAQYVFNTSTGTTSYETIPSGNHWVIVFQKGDYYVLCWNNCTSETFNFQSNRKYTFEYDGTDYWMRDDGAASAPEQSIISTKASLKTLNNGTKITELLKLQQ